jgi:hypothetical protein
MPPTDCSISQILKGQCHEIFYSGFFHQTSLPSLFRHAYKGFQIFLDIRGVIRVCNRIDSPVYSQPVSQDSLVYSSPGS